MRWVEDQRECQWIALIVHVRRRPKLAVVKDVGKRKASRITDSNYSLITLPSTILESDEFCRYFDASFRVNSSLSRACSSAR